MLQGGLSLPPAATCILECDAQHRFSRIVELVAKNHLRKAHSDIVNAPFKLAFGPTTISSFVAGCVGGSRAASPMDQASLVFSISRIRNLRTADPAPPPGRSCKAPVAPKTH